MLGAKGVTGALQIEHSNANCRNRWLETNNGVSQALMMEQRKPKINCSLLFSISNSSSRGGLMQPRGFECLSKRFTQVLRHWIIPVALAALVGSDLCLGIAPAEAWAASSTSSSQGSTKGRSSKHRRHRRLKVRRNFKPMPPLSEAPFASDVPLLPIIEKAKSKLEKETVLYFPGVRKQPSRREIRLALADFKTGEIKIVSGIESNQKFSLNDPGIQYRIDWWNGFNSSITILDPPSTGVVAMLYALDAERQNFLQQDAIIYSPYSSALLQSELVETGRTYLMEKIVKARKELESVPSLARPGESLASAQGLSNEDYFNLILTEQMDPGRFRSIAANDTEFSDGQNGEIIRLAERILVIIGANQEDAYSFTGNYASARGLTQFTPMGMRVVWSRYADAGITRDFREATRNHVSAIKAEICLLDHDLAELSGTYPGLMGSGYEKYAVGASYNGGPSRVHYGLKNFGVEWLHPSLRLARLSAQKELTRKERLELQWLKRNRAHETFVYLNKLHAIEYSQERLLSSKAIKATPNAAADKAQSSP
jgi:hypothetical protein